jgi:hypothetical protein
MVSTVTTSTVTTVSTVATLGLSTAFGVMAIAALLFFITAKEFALAGKGERSGLLPNLLRIGIIPLMLVFIFIVVFSVLQAMG